MAKIAPAESEKVKGTSYFAQSPSGRKIEYRLAGRCGKEDIVLLVVHGMVPKGFGAAHSSLKLMRDKVKGEPKTKTDEVIDQLPFKIVGVSRPGYDASTLNKSYKEMTYQDQCTDIIAVMDDVGAAKFAISASSSGGTVALTVAHAHPDRVMAVMLDCCDANYGPGFPKGKKMNEANADGTITYVDGNFRPGGATWWLCCMNPCCCCCACCPSGFMMDLFIEIGPIPYKLEEIKCPVQIIGGTADDSVDPNTSRFHASKLPNAKLEMIEGMGHCQIPGEVFEQKFEELRKLCLEDAAPTQSEMS